MSDSQKNRRETIARQFIEAIPHAKELGMQLTEIGVGTAVIGMDYDARLVGDPDTGVIHGGAVSALMDTLRNIQNTVNPNLKLEGIVRTMVDNRSRLTKDVSTQLNKFFGDKVFRTCIPRNIRLAEAPSHGLPVRMYDKSSRGSLAYLALAGELLKKAE